MARILIVEDNALNIKLFCDLLAAHGHETEAVTDSRLALDAARGFAPDLVITDIQLPHVTGLDLIELVRADAELKEVPIMAVTAYSAAGDEDRIRAAGAQVVGPGLGRSDEAAQGVRYLLSRSSPKNARTRSEAYPASLRFAELRGNIDSRLSKIPDGASKTIFAAEKWVHVSLYTTLCQGDDRGWAEAGHMARATELLRQWCADRTSDGLKDASVEVQELPGLSPLLLVEVPATAGGNPDRTVLVYGHLDKQPPFSGWRAGLGPWQPVIEAFGTVGSVQGVELAARTTGVVREMCAHSTEQP